MVVKTKGMSPRRSKTIRTSSRKVRNDILDDLFEGGNPIKLEIGASDDDDGFANFDDMERQGV